MLRKCINVLVVLVLALGMPATAFAQGEVPPELPVVDASQLAVEEVLVPEVAPELAEATGPVEIVVRLEDAPLAVAAQDASEQGMRRSQGPGGYAAALDTKQSNLMSQIANLGGAPLGRVRVALNAVIVTIDASQVENVAALPGVASVQPVRHYEVDLLETVPYIGATAVQNLGYDGTGIEVAVLDSGIDYMHANLGGSGSVAEYDANDPTIIEPGTFPTEKVVGGYDFVGEVWPNGARLEDPDPIDKGSGAGHGTHVADIIGGQNGVAPGVDFYAVKVCSSVSTSCNGIALLLGVDFALDPNMDGDTSDKVDVINLSLGSGYGQIEDDLSLALGNAVKAGVVVVASAGNNGDRPYITGSPAATPEVISVAQTYVPSAELYQIVAGSVTAGGSWQAWSGAPTYVSGPLQYGDGAGNVLACTPFAAGSAAGKIVIIDRGTCSISIKVSNVADGGALAVIIANNVAQAPGDLPPDFSYGGGDATRIAGYTVTRADGNALKTQLGQTTVIDPAAALPLVMNVVPSSSRGPSYSFTAIKPDIGAPGGSVSAERGTGTGETAFSGTSGAAPMVAGSAALLLDAYPDRSPAEIKAMLVNTGETNIGINPVALPGYLAPISRIGGGEVRVDRALATTTLAWDRDTEVASLSFGYHTVSNILKLHKIVEVHNYTNQKRTYTITPTYRYANDAASGAIKISVPKKISVSPNRSSFFKMEIQIDANKLPTWVFTGAAGAWGGDGYRLQDVEFDGYLNISDATDSIHVPWHVLPHRAAELRANPVKLTEKNLPTKVRLQNKGRADGEVDVFALTGSSPQVSSDELPGPGDNYAIIDLKSVGARLVSIGGGQYGIQFGISTYGARAHPAYPAEFDVYIDTNNDGTDDYVLYNLENGGFGVSGQTLVYVANLATGTASAYFYIDTDLQSGNVIYTAPLAALGIDPTTQITFSVYAFDNYFTGFLTDAIEGMVFTPGIPRYVSEVNVIVPARYRYDLTVSANPGGKVASPSQYGLLLMYRDSNNKRESEEVIVR